MFIRQLFDIQELDKIVELEKEVWDAPYKECVPSILMKGMSKIGGLILGAYIEKQLVGFTFTLIGVDQNLKPFHYLHSLAVKKSVQRQNIGFNLMKEHYKISGKMGFEKVKWTFDPLETVNANLYIRKLGAIIEDPFSENQYGTVEAGLNIGIPTDRFIASWYLTSDKVIKKMNLSDYESDINNNNLDDFPIEDYIINFSKTTFNKDLASGKVFIEVPSDFQAIKAHNIENALLIRLRSREVFTHYLSKGKKIISFFIDNQSDEKGCFYQID